ncbi:MAG: OmpA family protein [Opitutaceae bacterium]|jgi:peptidoglycan-associated lipoprotein
MNLSTKKLCFVIVAAAVVLTGCSKKPKRPDPSTTVIGPDNGLSGANVGGLNDGTLADLNSGLGARDPNAIDGQDRAALQGSTVYFEFDQSAIKASERTKLDAAKAYLEANPTTRLLLEGHCDWKGTAEYNLGLGDRRANAAKQYLVTSGVSADKLEVLSKGDLDAVENADDTTMAKDRRVDLVVLKQ